METISLWLAGHRSSWSKSVNVILQMLLGHNTNSLAMYDCVV